MTIYADRRAAGSDLARRLQHLRASRPLILALPRGGVPVAYEVAAALDAPLDLLFVRKLGAPGYSELGIGAVVDGADPQVVLNDDIIRQIQPGADYIRTETARQLAEIERRRRFYMGDRKPLPVGGRVVILIDDGIATGGTVRAGLAGLRRGKPARLILAVPVAPSETLELLRQQCDEIICPEQPHPFYAVGAHYGDFTQTEDAEVVALLKKASAFGKAAAGAGATDSAPPPPVG